MIENNIQEGGRTLYTEKVYEKAQEWCNKIISLEEKHKAELDEARQDTGKMAAISKMFYDEAGPVPDPVLSTLFMSKPVVAALYQYQKSLDVPKPKDILTPEGTWICSLCGCENSGNFCNTCGKKKDYNLSI